MKILINIKPLQNQSKTRGIGTYTRELVESLNKNYKKDSFDLSSRQMTDDYDLLHYPFFDPFYRTLKIPNDTPTVVTIHDLIPMKFKEHFPVGIRGKISNHIQVKNLKKATHIITDSNTSKVDIVNILNISENKITVIPLAPSTNKTKLTKTLIKNIKVKYTLPDKFILYVGDINWNKNIPGLIEEYTLSETSWPLVLVGKAFKGTQMIPELRIIEDALNNSPKREKIIRLGYVPDHHISAIYNLASIYVQPSYYEGFGLTVLEAMSNACPTIVSDQGSLPEVSGDSSLMFNPYKRGHLASAINKLASSNPARQALIKKGKTNVKKYTWRNTAKMTMDVYRNSLQ